MQNLKKMSFVLLFATGFLFSAHSQIVAVKTNIPYWVTTTPNLGVEFALGQKISLEISGGVNPFDFGKNRELKHWIVWPELRYWTCEAFNGHFLGLHGVGGRYSIGGWDISALKLDRLKNRRYEGNAIGVGVSYGYQWILSDRWGLEFTIGGGFARVNYDVYTVGENSFKQNQGKKYYFGPTKGGLSVVYVF